MSFKLIDGREMDLSEGESSYAILFDEDVVFDDPTLDYQLNEEDSNLYRLNIYSQDLSVEICLTVDAHKLINRLQESLNTKYYMRGYKQAIENMKKEKENQ